MDVYKGMEICGIGWGLEVWGLLKASLFDKTSSTEVVGQLKGGHCFEVSQNLVCKSLTIR